jgi:nucleoside-diphosphate-sugar epimerase
LEILVTGAAGYFGGAVLSALVDDPAVTGIVATDLRPPALAHPKVRFARRDLLAEGAEDLVAGADAVIHLAFTVERRPGVDPAALNVDANRRFLAAAVRAPVVLFASSVMAYGFREGGFEALREDDPPAPGRGFYYAEQKIASERLLAELAAGAPARVVVARPCAVGGPTLDARRAALYRGRVQLMPRVPHPLRVQLLHEADLGSAFRALLAAPAGVYNVAPDDDLTTDEVARLLGQWRLALPMGFCAWAMDRAWERGQGLMDGAWARTLAYPAQVASNAKLRGLGWAPRYSTRETIWATAGR